MDSIQIRRITPIGDPYKMHFSVARGQVFKILHTSSVKGKLKVEYPNCTLEICRVRQN
jgi:hypothetical protein